MLEDKDAVELMTELYAESASSCATSWSVQCWAGRIPAGVSGTVGLFEGLLGGGVFGEVVSAAVGEGGPCLVGSPLMVDGWAEQGGWYYDYSGSLQRWRLFRPTFFELRGT